MSPTSSHDRCDLESCIDCALARLLQDVRVLDEIIMDLHGSTIQVDLLIPCMIRRSILVSSCIFHVVDGKYLQIDRHLMMDLLEKYHDMSLLLYITDMTLSDSIASMPDGLSIIALKSNSRIQGPRFDNAVYLFQDHCNICMDVEAGMNQEIRYQKCRTARNF